MKKSNLFLVVLAMIASIGAFAGQKPVEGGGHVGINVDGSASDYTNTTFGYNQEAGKAWIIVEFSGGVSSDSMQEGGYLPTKRELAVEGLSIDSSTGIISYNGVPCAKSVWGPADYPQKSTGRCRFTPGVTILGDADFKGNRSASMYLTLDAE